VRAGVRKLNVRRCAVHVRCDTREHVKSARCSWRSFKYGDGVYRGLVLGKNGWGSTPRLLQMQNICAGPTRRTPRERHAIDSRKGNAIATAERGGSGVERCRRLDVKGPVDRARSARSSSCILLVPDRSLWTIAWTRLRSRTDGFAARGFARSPPIENHAGAPVRRVNCRQVLGSAFVRTRAPSAAHVLKRSASATRRRIDRQAS